MNCPWCRGNLVISGNVLVCDSTGGDVSEVASAALLQVVASAPADPGSIGPGAPGRWFCPADGGSTQEVEGGKVCTECGRLLPGSLIHQLLEFNWHPLEFSRRGLGKLRIRWRGETRPRPTKPPP